MQTKLKAMREARGWSQEKLAEMAGLSTRTIQRIESGQRVGLESWLALAAVFEMTVQNLQGATMNEENKIGHLTSEEQQILNTVRQQRNFYLHLSKYIVIILFLLVINLLTSPHYLWVGWVAFGWGVGLACRAFFIFSPWKWFDDEWERREVEKRIGRRL
ncbi:helix-turn-helix domain-containing protein [Suttonella ornithocola]|uniref:Predicted transcriptional regulator n=1 Tax=Suttonella ornithocola TaxID=279832 RepID=A0A380MZ96_9GAMM|nr:helix-turn-helix domain-containing protein [Suttonella ornithocola]SUO97598.1 Predicted transcriptional regulator [Suttonella ornithocola]